MVGEVHYMVRKGYVGEYMLEEIKGSRSRLIFKSCMANPDNE